MPSERYSPMTNMMIRRCQDVTPDNMHDEEFYEWLAGISSGEATFYSRIKDLPSGNSTVYNEFKITLRVDDKPLLDSIQRRLGVGQVHRVKAYGGAKAQASYRVIDKHEQEYVLVPIFEEYPLASKKEKDFEIWKEIVHISVTTDPTEHIEELAELVQKLKDGRNKFINEQSHLEDGVGGSDPSSIAPADLKPSLAPSTSSDA